MSSTIADLLRHDQKQIAQGQPIAVA